jgi:hypothetical protein
VAAPRTGAVVLGVEAITVLLVHMAMGVDHTSLEVMDMDQLQGMAMVVHPVVEVVTGMAPAQLVMAQDMVLAMVGPCMGMVQDTMQCTVLVVDMVMLVPVDITLVVMVVVVPVLVAAVIMVLAGAGDKGDTIHMESNRIFVAFLI